MGKTRSIEIYGSSNVGLYAYATDKYCLIGRAIDERIKESFSTALDVPVHEITISGSQQAGAYLNGNENCLLVPSIILPHEIKKLDELGIKYQIITTKHTALGNDLIIGDNYFFYMPEFEKSAVREIETALGIKGEPLELYDWDVIGSIVVVTKKGGLIQKDVPDEVKERIEKKLGVELERGTVNFGSHVLGGGLVVNSFGMIIGKDSAGIEVTNADMAFGFLKK